MVWSKFQSTSSCNIYEIQGFMDNYNKHDFMAIIIYGGKYIYITNVELPLSNVNIDIVALKTVL